jgi:hypothetical protein
MSVKDQFISNPIIYTESEQRLMQQIADDEYMDDVEKQFARKVINAFQGISLGDGIGYFEADCIDDFLKLNDPVRIAARSRDERHDWVKAYEWKSTQKRDWLSEYSFMDAKGLYFHLPVNLVSGLSEEYEHKFMGLKDIILGEWIHDGTVYLAFESMLTHTQKSLILEAWRTEVGDYASKVDWLKKAMSHTPCMTCGKLHFEFVPMSAAEIEEDKKGRDSYQLLEFYSQRWV